jgi:hypothetical protein
MGAWGVVNIWVREMSVGGFGWIGLVIVLRIISTQPGSLKVDEPLLIRERWLGKNIGKLYD